MGYVESKKGTWFDSNPETNGGGAGTWNSGQNTEECIAALNDLNFGGFNDWRLPTARELQSIVNYHRYSPPIFKSYFPNTVLSRYWSSTIFNLDCAWCVNFYDGIGAKSGSVTIENKSTNYYVRAVRSEKSETFDTLIINGDDTVTDPNTGLMWQQSDDGIPRNWKDALGYCENLSLGAQGDWRLPNSKELVSISGLSRFSSAIGTTYFPEIKSSCYWSSTTYSSDKALAWHVLYPSGEVSSSNKQIAYYVRAVRAGQKLNKYALTYTAGAGGAIIGEEIQSIEHGGDGSQVHAIAYGGYHFVRWSDGLIDNPRTDREVASDISVIAEFEMNAYPVSYTAQDNGNIYGPQPQVVTHGNCVGPVLAVPTEGYHFVGWSDGVTDNPRIDQNIISDTIVTALFAPNENILSYLAVNGSVIGEAVQTVIHGGDGAEVEVIPAEGYLFLVWSDGVTDNPRRDVGVRRDISVSAIMYPEALWDVEGDGKITLSDIIYYLQVLSGINRPANTTP